MKRLIALLILLLAGCSTPQAPKGPPPLPPMVKIKTNEHAATAAKRRTYYLTWSYSGSLPLPAGSDFEVWRSNTVSNFTLLLTTNQPPLRLPANEPVQYFRVRTCNSNGCSPWGSTLNVPPPIATPPGPASVTLAWTASTGTNVDNYNLYRWQPGATNVFAVGNVTNTTDTITQGITYTYGVKAQDTHGLESPLSNTIDYTAMLPQTTNMPAAPYYVRIISQ